MRCAHCKKTGVTIGHVKECSRKPVVVQNRTDPAQAAARIERVPAGTVKTVKFSSVPSDEQETRDIQARERADDERAYAAKAARDEELMASSVLDGLSRGTEPSRRGEPMNPPTDKTVNYVIGLQDERVLPEDFTTRTADEYRAMEWHEVSAKITMLKSFARKDGKSKQRSWTMPEGRYALTGADGDWRFYQVDKPTEGHWAGYTFLKQLIGAPGHYRQEPIRDRARRDELLQRIEDDPKQASIDYGHESRQCGRCSSPLTKKSSRERGMGDICAGKSGWF